MTKIQAERLRSASPAMVSLLESARYPEGTVIGWMRATLKAGHLSDTEKVEEIRVLIECYRERMKQAEAECCERVAGEQ